MGLGGGDAGVLVNGGGGGLEGGERIVGLGFGRRALCVSGSSAGVVVEGCPWWPWNPGVQASGKGGDRRRSQAGGCWGGVGEKLGVCRVGGGERCG